MHLTIDLWARCVPSHPPTVYPNINGIITTDIPVISLSLAGTDRLHGENAVPRGPHVTVPHLLPAAPVPVPSPHGVYKGPVQVQVPERHRVQRVRDLLHRQFGGRYRAVVLGSLVSLVSLGSLWLLIKHMRHLSGHCLTIHGIVTN